MTKRQYEAMRFIEQFIALNGHSPSYEEIATALGLVTKSAVHRLVNLLIDDGRLIKRANMARSLRVVGLDPFAGVSSGAMLSELKRRKVKLI